MLCALYGAELALLALLLSQNKRGEQPLLQFLQTTPGAVAALATLFLVASGTWIVFRARRAADRSFVLTTAMNLITVVMVFIAGEAMVRAAADRILEGSSVINDSLLLPRSWKQVSSNYRQALNAQRDSYAFRYDARTGWTWRANLDDANGVWTTSAEGLRSGEPGVAYRERSPQLRVAVVGDSFTYGEDVRFENSWVHLLETELGTDTQVLNFGVSAYGIDQILWKYEADVVSWRPNIVVFGVFPVDVGRAQLVYPFIRHPRWANPYSKPRMIKNDELFDIVNLPPLKPDELFSTPSIRDLPHLEYDTGYLKSDWAFRWYHHSALLRFVLSRFPRWQSPAPNAQLESRSVAREVFRRFEKAVLTDDATPIFVYLPSRRDVLAAASGKPRISNAMRALRENEQAYIDLTSCVAAVPAGDRFMFDGIGHYTPQASAAVARCLAEHLRS